MRDRWAGQYNTACVVPEGEDADAVIDRCREIGAIFREDGPDDECFVVELRRQIGAELWTERALRASFAGRKTAAE